MKYNGSIFKNRKFDFKKLKSFGFKPDNKEFVYNTTILDNTFALTLKINPDETIDVTLIETATNEDYNLIFVKNAEGEFIGKVKAEFEKVLTEIKDKCTNFSTFQTEQANLIIEYIKEKYGSPAEYLWEKFPENCIFRKQDNFKTGGKWFGAILTVKKQTLGLQGSGTTEVINLKIAPAKIDELIDNKHYFKAYHMNKKHWISINLDGSTDIKEIKTMIDESYKTLS